MSYMQEKHNKKLDNPKMFYKSSISSTICILYVFSIFLFGDSFLIFNKFNQNSLYHQKFKLYGKNSRGIEEFRESLNVPSENVVNAVSNTKNRRLTVSDAASKAGCDLRTAQKSLMTLASFTGGDLDVTSDGEIIFSFPEDFQSILLQRSTGEKIRRVYKILYPWLFYALRISFGVALITSLAIVTTMFVAVSSSSNNSDSDDRNRNRGSTMSMRNSGGSGINLNVVFGPSPFDFLYYSRPYGYYNYRYDYISDWQDPTQAMNERTRVGDGNYVRMSFLESVFSFLFGDGDPNNRLLDERTKRIAAYIRANKGTVVAEELAPFLDPPKPVDTLIALRENENNIDDYQSYVVDESWVMPAITRLGGVPTVTDDGDIVYSFPDLEASVGIDVDANVYDVDSTIKNNSNINTNANDNDGGWFKNPLLMKKREEALAQPIQEEEVPFSLASPSQTVMAAGLGAANLAGCLWLARLIRSPNWTIITASNPVLALTLGRIFPWMISYAITYAAIPIIRSAKNKRVNDEIKERNSRRLGWRRYLDKPDKVLANKIQAARVIAEQSDAVGQRSIGANANEIEYSTKQETEEEAFRLFDQKFNNDKNNARN